MMRNKLMHGLGMWASLEDFDGAGYLGLEESNAAQSSRIQFGAYSEGLAAEYLRAQGAEALAKQQLRADFQQIGASTDTGNFNDDEAALFERFAEAVDEAIDRLAKKPGWQRTMILWFHRTPGFVKALIFVAVFTVAAIIIGKVVGK
jgi:hypothetical protein